MTAKLQVFLAGLILFEELYIYYSQTVDVHGWFNTVWGIRGLVSYHRHHEKFGVIEVSLIQL